MVHESERSATPQTDRLYGHFRQVALKQLSRYRIPPEDAEDLLQDTMVLYLRKRPEVENDAKWLQGALRYRCLVYWRERRRMLYQQVDTALLEVLAERTPPSQEHRLFLKDVARLIEELPARCQTLLKLRYRKHLDPLELADKLGYRQSGIYKVIDRCIAALTRRLFLAPQPAKGKK